MVMVLVLDMEGDAVYKSIPEISEEILKDLGGRNRRGWINSFPFYYF